MEISTVECSENMTQINPKKPVVSSYSHIFRITGVQKRNIKYSHIIVAARVVKFIIELTIISVFIISFAAIIITIKQINLQASKQASEQASEQAIFHLLKWLCL